MDSCECASMGTIDQMHMDSSKLAGMAIVNQTRMDLHKLVGTNVMGLQSLLLLGYGQINNETCIACASMNSLPPYNNTCRFLTLPKAPIQSTRQVPMEEPFIDHDKNIMMMFYHYMIRFEQNCNARKLQTCKERTLQVNDD